MKVKVLRCRAALGRRVPMERRVGMSADTGQQWKRKGKRPVISERAFRSASVVPGTLGLLH